ncbi:MAG TPA: CaiB/BaiF CoA-transferase family protein [Kiloniellaceae bacterium]|nr:CaiB/BaiF CoA-transferase family protein [Kiloniellaceae bacterium]
MTAVLDDLLVLDFSTLLPGPMASLFLAEAGARVIKVERPGGGDDLRHYAPRWGGDGAAFSLLNRGKESIALDLKDPSATPALAPLLAEADILIEQFRPGVMDRLGFGYEALRKVNPDIVYCSITGYGQSGPRCQEAGHDLNYLADAGLLALSRGPLTQPTVPPALIADIAGGSYPALVNILLALRRRDRTGAGARIDIAMAESLFPFTFWAQAAGQATGDWPESGDRLLTGSGCRYRLYRTADDALLAVAALEDKFWQAFAAAIDLEPALRDDARDPAATLARVAAIVGGADADHWQRRLAAADCCCRVVRSLAEALEDPHFRGRGLFDGVIVNGEGAEMVALPLPLDPSLCGRKAKDRAPALGADNDLLAAGDPARKERAET